MRRPGVSVLLLTALALTVACGGESRPQEPPESPTQSAATPAATATARVGAGAPGSRIDTITAGGLQRAYRLYVPRSLEAGRPPALVLVMHGAGGEPFSFAAYSGFDPVADEHGFLVVYPAGLNATFNAGICCAGAGYDDVAFLLALVDHLSAEFSVDPKRVYATGHSNGGMMSFRLGCEAADRFAGVASVAGTLTLEPCTPSEPLAVLAVHGDADFVVPYNGGVGFQGLSFRPLPASVRHFAASNGCEDEPRTEVSGRVTTTLWRGCERGGPVEMKVIAGGSHAWPRQVRPGVPGADPDSSLDAAATVWFFFSQNPKP